MKQKILQRREKKGNYLYNIIFVLFVLNSCIKGNLYWEKDIFFIKSDTIEVVYSPVLMETPIGFGYQHLKSYTFQKADTVYLAKCDFLEIASCLDRFKIITKHEDCDSRFYIKYGKFDFYLQENPLYSCENKKTPFFKSKYALYLLLDKCLYFNHLPYEELEWNTLIKKYGIPEDYKYIPLYNPKTTTYYYWLKQNGNHGFLKTVLIFDKTL